MATDHCEFVTARLRAGPWHVAADRLGIDLAEVIAEMFTLRTTGSLPEDWHGDYTVDRAGKWIPQRDAESPTLLVTETASDQPVGIVVLAEIPLGESDVDVRLGYVIAERAWGRGLATELVSGLVDWSRNQPQIQSLTGGIDPTNQASARVLTKCGFAQTHTEDNGSIMYQIVFTSANAAQP